jgi:hypothetical protein
MAWYIKDLISDAIQLPIYIEIKFNMIYSKSLLQNPMTFFT